MQIFSPKFYHFNEVSSTIDSAFELLKAGEKCVVVTADFQNSGRGRNGKIWESTKTSNLLFTFGFKHSAEEIPLYLLQVVGSLASYELVSSYINRENVRLKYPNDVYAKANSSCNSIYKKIAGIISETNYVSENCCDSAIGIGINIYETPKVENSQNSIALCDCAENIKFDLKSLADDLTANIIKLLAEKEKIIKKWQSLLNIIGKKIIVKNEEEKQYYAVSILENCNLNLKDAAGNLKNIDNGDTILYDLE